VTFALIAVLFCILGALYALHAKELMRGILGLALFFTGLSIHFGLLGAWFLAVGQIFLFVGGIVALFVLAFSYSPTPIQHQRYATGVLVALATGALFVFFFPNVQQGATPASLGAFSSLFFTKYGLVLNVAILLLFSAVMTAQYVMTEDEK